MAFSVLTSKGQITIPKTVRTRLHLKTGDRIDFQVRNGEVRLVPVIKSVSDVFGILSKENAQIISIEQINEQLKKSISGNIK